VLERSLRTFLPPTVAADASREVASHIRERVRQSDGSPNERDVLEHILNELGAPLRVAQAYASEMTMEEAVTTGRLGPVVHAVRHLATTSLGGFFGALALFAGDALRAGLLAAVALEPILSGEHRFVGPAWHARFVRRAVSGASRCCAGADPPRCAPLDFVAAPRRGPAVDRDHVSGGPGERAAVRRAVR